MKKPATKVCASVNIPSKLSDATNFAQFGANLNAFQFVAGEGPDITSIPTKKQATTVAKTPTTLPLGICCWCYCLLQIMILLILLALAVILSLVGFIAFVWF